ncbi:MULTISPECIES: serine O-acetyltransferase EpsC [unclassified Treponema]|uniref:serine O-acetyltransferase EpsC n=1 Tax=unclassified Treponema TaxID=2638727 RepID=UPI0025CB77B5|nr:MULTISPECIES: serine O-acetyltransferase EpsC [unclassified Treponema]MBQ8678382.1 serine acetyltransferase [Treponema sp.]
MKIDELVDNILLSYEKDGGINKAGTENFPNRENVVSVLHDIQCLIFPGYKTAEELNSGNLRYITGQRINRIIAILTKEIEKALTYKAVQHDANSKVENSHCFALAEKASFALIEAIPEIRRLARLDTIAAYNGDPAAKSGGEVIVSYPGLEAIIVYRIAHFLYECGVPVIPRIMSEHVHGKTGIDIHPGAKIGESFFIDHGTGVVIGETTIIGNNVKIYQGVTLGALSVKKTLQNSKRHPTIEDNVTIYANATILGGETVIGKGSVIGGNSWITESVSNAK